MFETGTCHAMSLSYHPITMGHFGDNMLPKEIIKSEGHSDGCALVCKYDDNMQKCLKFGWKVAGEIVGYLPFKMM